MHAAQTSKTVGFLILAVCLWWGVGHSAFAEEGALPVPPAAAAPASVDPKASAASPEEPGVDFKNEETFIDVSEALHSKHYVHRAILSSVVKDTSRFNVDRIYLNHLVGFASVWQRSIAHTKYTSGIQALSVGYVNPSGHGVELGLELATVSNLFAGYRYFYRPEKLMLWGFIGGGVGMEIKKLSFADGPPEAALYDGMKQMGFLTFGFLVPLVDVGLKAELRFNFYGIDRWVLTEGIGAILFL